MMAENSNPGDMIADLGLRYILGKALGHVTFYNQIYYRNKLAEAPSQNMMPAEFGLVSCTPWVWDRCAESDKYKAHEPFQNSAPIKCFFGVGGGAMYPIVFPTQDYIGEQESKTIGPFWKNYQLLIVRDGLTYKIFSEVQELRRVLQMPCPSIFISQAFDVTRDPNARDPLLIYCALAEKSIPFSIRQDEIDAIHAFQHKLITSGIPVLTMTTRDDIEFSEKYPGIPHAHTTDPREIVGTVAQHVSLISARVHGCMCGISLGIPTYIIPVDTRALTCVQVGAEPLVTDISPLIPYISPLDRSQDHYMNTLRHELNCLGAEFGC